jgi:ABC-2 type transport system permease protein
MKSALRYEWVRIRTLRSSWVLAISALLTSAVISWLLAQFDFRDTEITAASWADSLAAGPTAFAPLLMSLVGIFTFGHEYRHGLIRPTLTAVPRRSVLIAAKIIIVGVLAGIVTIINFVVSLGLHILLLGDQLGSVSSWGSPVPRVFVGAVLLTVIWSLIGLALAGLLRNVPGSIVLILVWPLVVEPLLLSLTVIDALKSLRGIVVYLPFIAGNALSSTSASANQGSDSTFNFVSPLVGGLTFAGFMTVLMAATWILFERRDA